MVQQRKRKELRGQKERNEVTKCEEKRRRREEKKRKEERRRHG